VTGWRDAVTFLRAAIHNNDTAAMIGREPTRRVDRRITHALALNAVRYDVTV